jgi:lipopolysaccharide assembly outer membrane protein LptD (OstA)
MRKPFLLISLLVSAIGFAKAEMPGLGDLPVEITSSGGTNFKNGIATARDNVAIHVGDTDIYGDSAEYNSRTREITVDGNTRIYRDVNLYVGEHAVYNLDTKLIRTTNMRTEHSPYLVFGEDMTTRSATEALVHDGTFTTDDSSDPGYRLHARTVRIYEKDRVVFVKVTH